MRNFDPSVAMEKLRKKQNLGKLVFGIMFLIFAGLICSWSYVSASFSFHISVDQDLAVGKVTNREVTTNRKGAQFFSIQYEFEYSGKTYTPKFDGTVRSNKITVTPYEYIKLENDGPIQIKFSKADPDFNVPAFRAIWNPYAIIFLGVLLAGAFVAGSIFLLISYLRTFRA